MKNEHLEHNVLFLFL